MQHLAPNNHRIPFGFSLVELLVAMAIGLVLVAGVATVAVNTGRSHRQITQVSEQLENGRYAMEVVREDLRHAGFFGEFYAFPTLPAALPNPCDSSTANLIDGFRIAVQGYDSPSTSPLTCIVNANFSPGTDILVVRRVSTTPITNLPPCSAGDDSCLKAGRLYLQTRSRDFVLAVCSSDSACTGTDSTGTALTGTPAAVFSLTQKDGSTLATIRSVEVHIYFIRPWTESPGDGVPTLARVILTDGGTSPAMTTEPLIPGIESMQIQYGLDNGASGGTPADGSPDEYVTNPANVNEWSNVVAVNVNVLVRQTAATGGYTDATTYDLGEGGVTPGGAYQRHLYSGVVRLVNVGGRREI